MKKILRSMCKVGLAIAASLVLAGGTGAPIYANYQNTGSDNDMTNTPQYYILNNMETTKINLLTEDVPISGTYVNVKQYTADADYDGVNDALWRYEKENIAAVGVGSDASAYLNDYLKKARNTGDFAEVTNKKCAVNMVLPYEILYDGCGILIPAEETNLSGNVANAKLEYCIADTSTDLTALKWAMVENKISVPVKTTYTYDRYVNFTSIGSINSYDYSSGSMSSHTAMGYDETPGAYVKTKGWGDSVDGSVDGLIQYNQHGIYSDDDSNSCKNVPGKTDPSVVEFYLSTEGFNSLPIYPVQETITFYDEMDFYFIPTSTIAASHKTKYVFMRSANNPKEIYYVVNSDRKTIPKLSVKYVYGEGFKVNGLTTGTGWKQWITNGYPRQAEGGNNQYLLWKTQTMDTWSLTTPETMMEDIPVEQFSEYGVTLQFMDANNPITVAKAKIPAQAEIPKVKLKLDAEDFYLTPVSNKLEFRVWDTIDLKNGKPTYRVVSPSIGISATSNTNDDKWYEYVYTSGKKNTLSLLQLSGITDYAENKGKNVISGMSIEIRTRSTGKKKESKTVWVRINPQVAFPISDSGTITLSEGKMNLSFAGKENAYEYKLADSTPKWKSIKSQDVKDKNLTPDTKIWIRKAAYKTSDGTTVLPSTYLEFTIPSGSAVYKSSDIKNMAKK